MKNFMAIFLALMSLALAACSAANVKDADYERYATAIEAQAQATSAMIAGLAAATSACNGDARCVEHVSSMAALAMAGSGRGSTMQAPQRKPTGAENFAMVMSGMNPLLGGMMNAYVGIEQSKSSERMAEAQYSFLGGVIRDTSAASVAISASGPRITVGGDYVPGTQTVVGRDQVGGDQTHVGRDQIGRDQHIGDTVGGDQAGRDNNTNSHVGDNDRNTSPGPYTGSCVGDGCQPVTTPEPDGD